MTILEVLPPFHDLNFSPDRVVSDLAACSCSNTRDHAGAGSYQGTSVIYLYVDKSWYSVNSACFESHHNGSDLGGADCYSLGHMDHLDRAIKDCASATSKVWRGAITARLTTPLQPLSLCLSSLDLSFPPQVDDALSHPPWRSS